MTVCPNILFVNDLGLFDQFLHDIKDCLAVADARLVGINCYLTINVCTMYMRTLLTTIIHDYSMFYCVGILWLQIFTSQNTFLFHLLLCKNL